MSKPTQLGTIAGMTALFGALPLLLTFIVFHFVPDGPPWLYGFSWLLFFAAGGWIFVAIFDG